MKSNKYWEERKLRRFSENEQRTTEYVKSIRKMYEQASRNIKKMLDDVYKNYSNDTGIDKQKLRELLTKSETEKHFEELKKIGLEKYVKDNYKSRINRLERIQLELYKATKDLYKKEELKHSELYKEVINNAYYKAIYDTQIGVGYDFNFSNLDKNLIKSLMSEKWHGLNYSERIWNNTEIIANQIKDIVGGGLLSGQSIQKTARLVRERFDVGKFYSERLVRTESNYFHNQADLMAYEEMEVEYYIIIATLDNRTSKICQEKDGKKFKVTEALKGKNFPPFHVNCRTTTSSYIDEEAEKLLIRRARNPINGKNEVIDNVSYEEWLKNKTSEQENIQITNNYMNFENTNTYKKLENSVEYKKVNKLTTIISDDKIIEKISGGDKTSGSCVSVGIAYIGNKVGYDVTDFRGGNSQFYFSRFRNIVDSFDDIGVEYIKEKNTNDFKSVSKLLQNVIEDKEYFLITGSHASIIKKVKNSTWKYLELQSPKDNGFKELNNYILTNRFGCQKTHTIYGEKVERPSLIVDIDNFKNKSNFIKLLGYINTNAIDQQKGVDGFEK